MKFDVLIIGGGLAGLATAIKFDNAVTVALIIKKNFSTSSSHWAQGGVAGVLNKDDKLELHEQDTLVAGAGLCNKDAVKFVVENSEQSIQWLIDQGIEFTKTKDNQSLHLTKEGGHSLNRIALVADFTGKAIQEKLIEQVIAKKILLFLKTIRLSI
jgi:L-aspartate oxidase